MSETNLQKTANDATVYLEYPLHDGYIHNWLAAGPQAIPIDDLTRFPGDDFKHQIARHYHRPDSGIAGLPRERDLFVPTGNEAGKHELAWRAVTCREDHFVDLTAFYPTCHYLCAWAYVQIESAVARQVCWTLTTHGPAGLWLNGQPVHRHEHFSSHAPHGFSFQAALQAGRNEVLVRFEQVAVRECPYAVALRMAAVDPNAGAPTGLDTQSTVWLPSSVPSVVRRRQLERLFAAAYVDRDVYAKDDTLEVRWPDDLDVSSPMALRLQTPSGRIYLEKHLVGKASETATLGGAFQAPEGAFQILLMPRPEEYYVHGLRVQRAIDLHTLHNSYAQVPYGTYEERRYEALLDATRRNGIFAEIAKMALGQWSLVESGAFEQAMAQANLRADGSAINLVGLLGMLVRYADNPAFPAELKRWLEGCALGYRYWLDEPGEDAMCFWSESHQILFHTCEILAGQLYPERIFSNAGQTGAWHREKGERMALSWLRKRGQGGFREWDSNCSFERDVLALSHLADLAHNPDVAEMAAVVLDKLCFTMALNSYRGVFGSSHGRSDAIYLKGGRLEPTAGIARLLWGIGTFNQHILGTVSLACAQGYSLPPLIAQIAADLPEELWNRERHAGEMEEWSDRESGTWEVNKVTYRTPDYMLCSAQDYRPGAAGSQQHIWQATLGPDAAVFVTHPPCASQGGAHRPNFWLGNAVLPRVAQWKDFLVAVHRLPEDDWMGFTHAYFPVAAFDEVSLRDGWAFARSGDGYLALTAACGLQQITQGENAYRELRSYGYHNVWLCQMGRAALDGSFAAFQEKVLALKITYPDALWVRAGTLRGDEVAFAWEGPLLVNGEEQAITGFRHYDNPYCVAELPATTLEIGLGDQLMRLHFQ